jgi:hypothetical protein
MILRPPLTPFRRPLLRPVLALALAAVATAGCSGGTIGRGSAHDMAGQPPPGDGGAGRDLAVLGGPCDDQHACPTGQRCLAGACIPDNGTCTDDSTCESDTYCDCTGGGGADMGPCLGGACVPYGVGPRGPFNPGCTGQSFSSSELKAPVVKCQWNQANVIMTPLVVDLDLDGKPEIVFVDNQGGNLYAMRGATCQIVWQQAAGLNVWGQIAAADLDGDKYPEIIATTPSHVVAVFDHNGNLLATATQSYGGSGLGSDCNGPAIVEIDGVAPPEIVVAGQVSRYVKGQGIQTLFTNPVTNATWGTMSAAADLDGDGVPEIVASLQVYDGKSGLVKTPPGWSVLGTSPGAYPAIADFNHDKKPDVVLVQSASRGMKVSVWDWANQKFIFGPMPVTGGWGGPPTVADFDGDGTPDFGSAGGMNYFVFSMKCWPNGGIGCAAPGILWQKTTHDNSSGGTGSSVFDFNGDGKAEVVYRDECFFRVIDGTTGKTDFAQQITSGTCLENPVIADVDSDGHADVVVPSDNVQGNYCSGASDPDTGQVWSTQTRGVFVLQDPLNRWLPSRSIWNQHSYHITNVNDDDTIPYPEVPSWTTWNDYRANVQGILPGTGTPAPDYTGGVSSGIDNGGNDCKVSERLWAQICNRGTAQAAAGVAGTFYTSDPRQSGATKICTATTKMALAPGACEAVYCDWANPPQGAQNLWFRADDDGARPSAQSECNTGNDLLYLPSVTCFVPG